MLHTADIRSRGAIACGESRCPRRGRSRLGDCLSASQATSKSSARSIKGDEITWRDVEVDNSDLAVRMRREMEAAFAPAGLEAVRSTG